MANQSIDLDRCFHALADPTRRAILARLVQREQSFSEVTAPFPMAKPTLLKHVQVLEESGLITTEKKGRVRLCRLKPQALKETEGWLAGQIRLWETRFDQLDAYLLELMHREEQSDDGRA